MRKRLIALFSLLAAALGAQTGGVATFYADTMQLSRSFYQNRGEEYNEVLQTLWRIKGETLFYGRLPLEIPVDTIGPDTIFYQQGGRKKWDTLICCISKPGKYKFVYNDCCNSFYLQDEKGIVNAPVLFNLHGHFKGRTFIGLLDEAGSRFTRAAQHTFVSSRGPMVPNVYSLLVREAVICNDTTLCKERIEELIDPATNDYEVRSYRTVSTQLDCHFLPLARDTIRVTYDVSTKTLKIGQ